MFTRCSFLAGILSLCAVVAQAGPLAPPAGAVTSTARFGPRIELSQETTPGSIGDVYRITSPGSYYLAEDLAVPANMNGIQVSASDVSIDLNGFTIRGEPGSSNGVSILRTVDNIVIQNGVIRDMGLSAIVSGSEGDGADRCVIENVYAYNSGLWGFLLHEYCTFRNCIIDTAQFQGILAGRGALIESCLVRNLSDGDGFKTGPSSRVVGCVAENVMYAGTFLASGDGFLVGSDSVVMGCLSVASARDGFDLGDRCMIADCAAFLNGQTGFALGESSLIDNCLSSDNLVGGVSIDERSTMRRCYVARTGTGIVLGSSCAAVGNSVVECTLVTSSGISVPVNSTGCLVDSNFLSGNTDNMNVLGTGNTIVRNISQAGMVIGINIVGGNFAGAIVANPAVAGPWDNLEN